MLCETARGLALKQGYTEIRGLVQCVQKTHSAKAKEFEVLNDEIIMAAIKVLANQSKEVQTNVILKSQNDSPAVSLKYFIRSFNTSEGF